LKPFFVTGITIDMTGLKKVACFKLLISVVLSAYYLSLLTKASHNTSDQWRISIQVFTPYLTIASTTHM
jgi:hypothetical protein